MARMSDTVKRLVRFFISGGTGATVHLGVLALLVEFAGLYPVIASAGGFLVAFSVSFTLQKFWTFQDHDTAAAPRQMAIYFGIQVTNLFLNMLLMYLLIEVAHVQYVVAQIGTIGVIAIEAYFLYTKFVFGKPGASPTLEIPTV
jgi:putative flippase GtrA